MGLQQSCFFFQIKLYVKTNGKYDLIVWINLAFYSKYREHAFTFAE